uniref:Uncharacterized protein n=1 Tax=Anguilla anguilla TaxID=7936 RepID=A0A0E9VJR2_ANGAN
MCYIISNLRFYLHVDNSNCSVS